MQIDILTINPTKQKYIQAGVNEYISRIAHYTNISLNFLPAPKNASKMTTEELKKAEAAIIIKQVKDKQKCFLLDEKGKSFSSVEFSKEIEKNLIAGYKNITFIIGGAYGFHQSVLQKFPDRIAFSKMTFSHQMIRLILVEQLYRAFTIIKGEKYHH